MRTETSIREPKTACLRLANRRADNHFLSVGLRLSGSLASPEHQRYKHQQDQCHLAEQTRGAITVQRQQYHKHNAPRRSQN